MTSDIELERDRIARIRERCRQVCDDMDRVLEQLGPPAARPSPAEALRRRVAAENAAARELCRLMAAGTGVGDDPEKDWPGYILHARAVLRAAADAAA